MDRATEAIMFWSIIMNGIRWSSSKIRKKKTFRGWSPGRYRRGKGVDMEIKSHFRKRRNKVKWKAALKAFKVLKSSQYK